ncbi:hypothetical protein [Clostridium lacusfryxellense]|uniref:hypothetical protein n=1 Tax=Clostridium lacusfryxellense TaxID=205328 RepID=UPI001C0C4367|nr:hypothetical protein [Clostridium lacusfryxellense]MBU3114809.1 hypothetical protein [Clostridium lacusfryxellense]
MEKYVYVVISRTPTSTGKLVRKFLKEEYNHASISLDKDLIQMYSFCRFSISNPLVGGIVRESAFTLNIGRKEDVPINVYRIPVSVIRYELIRRFIYDIYNDDEIYYYNFLQAMGVISNKKRSVYKTYICTEFVTEALKEGGINVPSLESYHITPTDICEVMDKFIFYSGNLNDYPYKQKVKTKEDELFFCKTGFIYEGLHTLRHFWMVLSRDRQSKRASSRSRI